MHAWYGIGKGEYPPCYNGQYCNYEGGTFGLCTQCHQEDSYVVELVGLTPLILSPKKVNELQRMHIYFNSHTIQFACNLRNLRIVVFMVTDVT